jgi:ABC-2 type transport system ATP-binding protein
VTFAHAPPPGLFDIPGVKLIRRDGAKFHLQAQSAIDAVLKAIATQTVVDLRTEQPSLEDVFLTYYTGRQPADTPTAADREEAQRASA